MPAMEYKSREDAFVCRKCGAKLPASSEDVLFELTCNYVVESSAVLDGSLERVNAPIYPIRAWDEERFEIIGVDASPKLKAIVFAMLLKYNPKPILLAPDEGSYDYPVKTVVFGLKAEVPEEFVQAVKALNRMWGKLSKSRRREIEENPSTEKVFETLSIAALTS